MTKSPSSTPNFTATLPEVILQHIASYTANLEDLVAFKSACKSTNLAANSLPPKDLLRITYQSRQVFFRPSPEFLLAYLAPSIATFAAENEDNRKSVHHSYRNGAEKLLVFACHNPQIATISKWSFKSIRSAWQDRMDLWNPLEDLLDKCVGDQWYNIPEFWNGGRDDPFTILSEPGKIGFQLAIYGGLFGVGFGQGLEGAAEAADMRSKKNKNGKKKDDKKGAATGDKGQWDPNYPSPIKSVVSTQRLDFLKHVLPNWRHGNFANAKDNQESLDTHKVLYHLLEQSPLWGEVLMGVRNQCGGEQLRENDKIGSQVIWRDAVYFLGLDGLKMIRSVWAGLEEAETKRERDRQKMMKLPVEERPSTWTTRERIKLDEVEVSLEGEGWEKLTKWRKLIEKLDKQPKSVVIHKASTREFPYLHGDLEVLLRDSRGMW